MLWGVGGDGRKRIDMEDGQGDVRKKCADATSKQNVGYAWSSFGASLSAHSEIKITNVLLILNTIRWRKLQKLARVSIFFN